MDMRITRTQFRADGIFGEMRNNTGKLIVYTLEHAYDDGSGNYLPKTPAGDYICERGPHRLHGMVNSFETFEIMDVPGHTNILLHAGNWQKDSEGCFLLGAAIVPSSKGQMVTNSRVMFAEFMEMQKGLKTFKLTIED